MIMENAYFQSIMVPGKAMLPATYLNKSTGHDVFLRRAKLEESFLSLDGLYDCLPWVGDSKKRGATKGLLRTATWQIKTENTGDKATARFSTDISYTDFTTGKTNRLAFAKTITGSSKHAQLRMDYEIENTGLENAKFIFVGHARVAAGGTYDRGDYVYVPGTNCWVMDFKWPALEKLGAKPYSWARWPVEGVIDFTPKEGPEKKGEYIYAFVPASWAVVGDEKSKEYAVFHCSSVRLGKTVLPEPYWCILHRDGDYILELSLSRDLDAANWDKAWATVALAPGETAHFTVCMTLGQGLVKADFEKVTEAAAERLVFSGASGQTNSVLRLTP
ncbi:MAG: hypothetical protein PHW60_11215 [Kiritimatiellae bacterium]|nr:hypothetical protein [Kiritimatiellia bacterium]